MACATKDHVSDIGGRGLTSHEGTERIRDMKGSRMITAKDRLRKYGEIIQNYGENLSFNCFDAKEVMLHLLIDDGSRSRSHRNNIMNKEFNYMGASTGDHSKYGQMTCINYAAGYVAKGEPDPLEKQVDEFLKDEVEFEMPKNVSSWK